MLFIKNGDGINLRPSNYIGAQCTNVNTIPTAALPDCYRVTWTLSCFNDLKHYYSDSLLVSSSVSEIYVHIDCVFHFCDNVSTCLHANETGFLQI